LPFPFLSRETSASPFREILSARQSRNARARAHHPPATNVVAGRTKVRFCPSFDDFFDVVFGLPPFQDKMVAIREPNPAWIRLAGL